jgi:imidazolonepropionase-like amidohydrolase
MTTLLVQHTVESFDDWKVGFDNHESSRRLHGATGHRVLRHGEAVTLLIDFPDAAAAEGFASDPGLKEAMSKAGVIGAPAISYLDDVESVSY